MCFECRGGRCRLRLRELSGADPVRTICTHVEDSVYTIEYHYSLLFSNVYTHHRADYILYRAFEKVPTNAAVKPRQTDTDRVFILYSILWLWNFHKDEITPIFRYFKYK